jgi:DNA-binding NarL/FixJ family response regulator
MSLKKDKFETLIDNTKRYFVFVTNNPIAQKCLLSGLELVFKNIESKSATDIKSAKALLASKKPDLLFLDLELKDNEKGIALLEGQDRSKKTYPIVLLTKTDNPDLMDSVFNLGIDDIILVPENSVLNPDLFLHSVKGIVQGKHVAPLSVLGRSKGLDSASATFNGEIVIITESLITLRSEIVPAIGATFSLKLQNLVIPCLVTSQDGESKGPKKVFEAKIDYTASQDLNPRQIREIIFKLKTKGLK